MPFNPSVFKTRAITAIFFVLIMLFGLLISPWFFLILFGIILFGCLIEFVSIMKIIYPSRYGYYSFFGLIYIIMPVIMIVDLALHQYFFGNANAESSFSFLFPAAIVFSVWINDTMAYLVGSFIGKTPFSKISPKKTWEGTIGGIILCIAVITLLGMNLPISSGISPIHWASISAIVAVFGTIGDLFESKLKRMAGLKDSGKIMPGHGGFLDRFDSLLVATPFAWLYIRMML